MNVMWIEDTMGLAELLNIKATAAEPFARSLDMVALGVVL
jgi:hypothetical protein